MKTLLKNAQQSLRDKFGYIRSVDIFITPHENFIPRGTQFPAIGIKDGGIDRTRLMGGEQEDQILTITYIPYVRFFSSDQVIIGTDVEKGLLDVVEELHAALKGNFLGDPGVEDIFSKTEKPSENFGKEGDGLQRKLVPYQYERRITV